MSLKKEVFREFKRSDVPEAQRGRLHGAYVQDVRYADFASWRLLLVQEQKSVPTVGAMRPRQQSRKKRIFRNAQR